MQGILVSVSNNGTLMLLDDGTGIIELSIDNACDFLRKWEVGMYVMVVGKYLFGKDDPPSIKV